MYECVRRKVDYHKLGIRSLSLHDWTFRALFCSSGVLSSTSCRRSKLVSLPRWTTFWLCHSFVILPHFPSPRLPHFCPWTWSLITQKKVWVGRWNTKRDGEWWEWREESMKCREECESSLCLNRPDLPPFSSCGRDDEEGKWSSCNEILTTRVRESPSLLDQMRNCWLNPGHPECTLSHTRRGKSIKWNGGRKDTSSKSDELNRRQNEVETILMTESIEEDPPPT